MIGVWVNKPNTMEAYIPERIILLKQLEGKPLKKNPSLSFS